MSMMLASRFARLMSQTAVIRPATPFASSKKSLARSVLPERSCPQIYKLGGPNVFVGTHPQSGEMFIDHGVDVLAAYCNAVQGQDGWGSMPASFIAIPVKNCRRTRRQSRATASSP